MKQPPVRELLASYLLKRQDVVLQRLLALIDETPELAALRGPAHGREYQQAVDTLLKLMVQNIADPHDRRCFHYARQRAQERFRQNISASQMLRLAGLHRQVLTRMVQRQFSDDPALLRQMIDLIDVQISEIEITFADAYQSARDRQWQLSETKYFSLFENASEAILSFRPGEGRIIELNVQAERLLGQGRAVLLGTPFPDLFPAEHREEIKWLVQQPSGTSNIRLEDVEVQRADGLVVPVSLSCNWIDVEGNAVVQAIMRDVTQLRQMQRELQSHTEQLEARVKERTLELQQSEERFRVLFLQEQRRAQHLSLINEVQKCALSMGTPDIAEFLHQAVTAIQTHFRGCDVTFYLSPEARRGGLIERSSATSATIAASFATGEENAAQDGLVVIAQTGGHGLAPPLGGRLPWDTGLAGQAARRGETLYAVRRALDAAGPTSAANGVLNGQDDLQHLLVPAPGAHREARAEICVPVVLEGEMMGVLCVKCEEAQPFDQRDAVALQTAAAIIASHIHSSRLFAQMRDLNEFNQTLITTMAHSLMVVDAQGRIRVVNERLCQTVGRSREDLQGQPCSVVLSESVLEEIQLGAIMRDITETGVARELNEVVVRLPGAGGGGAATLVFDLRLSRVFFRGEPQVVVLLMNITQRWRKTQQRQMLNDMARFFQASLDINKVLRTVLTAITAGSALGFNRAFLLLREADNQEGREPLNGAMALGPSSPEEANYIWWTLSQRALSLQEILEQAAASDASDSEQLSALQQRALALTIDLHNPCFKALATAVRERRAVLVRRDELFSPQTGEVSPAHLAERQAAQALFTAPVVAVAPLVAKERIVGVVLADNLYSGHAIEEDDVQLLDTLAQQAGLAIDNALIFQALQKAHRDLVSTERLAVIGEMAARVSHEIRNPLATIGGWARRILKRPDDVPDVERKAGIIVDEVVRLEQLLTDLLDMARPRPLDLKPHALNDIVEHALLLAQSDLQASGVRLEKRLDPQLPILLVDRSRLLQALLNTARNGAQAMPGGGTLTVTTRPAPGCIGPPGAGASCEEGPGFLEIEVRDTGVGISTAAVKQVFDPFFSTKVTGSGLGLAVTRRIVEDHGGHIDVHSEEGRGTAFILRLPLNALAAPASSALAGVAKGATAGATAESRAAEVKKAETEEVVAAAA